ncbi:helix-hairpin-helix domain-containing protein [Sinomonas sp. P47F7]|uniref:helix-hairpin-helix domain-containing protein n=1 Tax=Sinomonas sp. P47F7 TaxID=3410987 RepID=UPI003BF4ABDF
MGRRARTAQSIQRWDRYTGLLDLGPPGEADEDLGVNSSHDAEQGPRRRWALSAGLAALVVTLLGACAGIWWWSVASDRPSVRSVDDSDPLPSADGGAGATTSGARSPGTDDGARPLVVHVTGAVASPGVYRLPEGTRVHEAIAAAGGPAPGAEPDRLNLAATLVDGARLVVPRNGEPVEDAGPAPGSSPSAGRGSPSTKVNVNRASADELSGLPRVGPVLAQRIVDYRTQHGRFASVDALDAVPGIGPRMLDSLRLLVTV